MVGGVEKLHKQQTGVICDSKAANMVLKNLMKKFQPVSLYIILTLTIFYFLLQLVVSYITHALTLTIDSYLVICNLIALLGCIVTVKVCDDDKNDTKNEPAVSSTSSDTSDEEKSCKEHLPSGNQNKVQPYSSSIKEKRLRNTFGWARIDVLVMLIGCVAFASLCFSTVLEAVQTLLHISHEDEMHYPMLVFCVGAFGLILNALSYLLIGGYTFHHGSCLRITPSGTVVLDSVITTSGHRKLNIRSNLVAHSSPGLLEMCRDITGCILVMICSAVVHFSDPDIAKLVDPILSIISASLLIGLTYPYMKESCCILLQTIPNNINIDLMCRQLMKDFPDVLNVHDLHVWQFSRDKTFLTAHIIFLSPQVYNRTTTNILNFFRERGITIATIQPEFFKDSNCIELISSVQGHCLVKCLSPDCYERYCCDLMESDDLRSICVTHGIEHSTPVKVPETKSVDSQKSCENNQDCQSSAGNKSDTCISTSGEVPRFEIADKAPTVTELSENFSDDIDTKSEIQTET